MIWIYMYKRVVGSGYICIREPVDLDICIREPEDLDICIREPENLDIYV